MSKIVKDVIVKNPDLSGVWQIASKPISKYDLLCMINEKMGLNIEIENDNQFVCDRSLDGKEFIGQTGFEAPSWNDMISELASEQGLGFAKK